jgi:1,4-dihydroxy-2-naphthoate octaprenyltransferase
MAYTGGPYPLGYHGLGDLFVFLFFGLVAVGATYFVQAGEVSVESLLAGAAVGLLAANILLVNNYRDVETDAKAGKRTLVVRWGRGYARAQFAASHAVALAMPLVLAACGAGSWLGAAAMAVVLAPFALGQIRALASATEPAALIRLLGRTGRYVALYAVLLSAFLIWK